VGKPRHQGAQHGEAAESGIENANGGGHGLKS
jgi:hypothetical protein